MSVAVAFRTPTFARCRKVFVVILSSFTRPTTTTTTLRCWTTRIIPYASETASNSERIFAQHSSVHSFPPALPRSLVLVGTREQLQGPRNPPSSELYPPVKANLTPLCISHLDPRHLRPARDSTFSTPQHQCRPQSPLPRTLSRPPSSATSRRDTFPPSLRLLRALSVLSLHPRERAATAHRAREQRMRSR